MRGLSTSSLAVLIPTAASAHPDHAVGSGLGMLHFVSDPFHLATAAMTLGAALLLVRAWQGRRSRSTAVHLRR